MNCFHYTSHFQPVYQTESTATLEMYALARVMYIEALRLKGYTR